jgi:single-stranded-DNA-specific exonuclease
LVRPPAPPQAVERLMRELKLPPTLAAMLWGRGLVESAAELLEPTLSPTEIPDLDPAAERLELAIAEGKRIRIHGDYDADGISGTAVLTLGLRALGARVEPFLPHRLHDGYGVSPNRVQEHAAAADLFITVDCGISNLDELADLQAAGVEVIVTDHHQPGERLPDCLIVHPKMSPQAGRGLPELTGAGVAYHLLWALHRRLGLEAPTDFADLATIGTIADVAPLLGENRALIRTGLARMADSRWPGLRAAVKQYGLRGEIRARDVAFVLGPRLNASGRLGQAERGLELLTTASERRGNELAAFLDALNQERRQVQDTMFEQALAAVDPTTPAIVVEQTGWHAGVMGIVASKLLDRYYKPVFIVAGGKGSVRSTPGISAVEALKAASGHLERFGGHTAAAGFSLREGALDAFRDAIHGYVAAQPTPVPTLIADALLAPDEVGHDLLEAVRGLEPYGEGHPAPKFALTEPLESARAVGKTGATLQLRLGGVKGVAWQRGELAAELLPGQAINTVVELRENVWKERRTVEFLADGVRPAQPLGAVGEPAGSERVRRGRPPMPAHEVTTADDLDGAGDGPLLLTDLPLGEGDGAWAPLADLIGRGVPLHFDLAPEALAQLIARADAHPTLGEVRRAFVALRRGRHLPYEGLKGERALTILRELDLVDGLNRARSGQRRDPYSSETLLTGLMARYRLRTFVQAYRQLDDDAFAQAVSRLFAAEGQPQDGAAVPVRY